MKSQHNIMFGHSPIDQPLSQHQVSAVMLNPYLANEIDESSKVH